MPVVRVAPDGLLDAAELCSHGPGDERLVRLLHAPRLQLRLERDLGGVVARDDEQAARVAVEPMDDPGPPDTAERRELAPPRVHREQRVDDRAVLVPGRRMRHEPGGLVDDEDVGVLVDDRRAGWPPARRRRRATSGTSSSSRAPAAHRVPGAHDPAGRGQAALRDEPLDVRAREPRRVGHEAVGATAGRARRAPRPRCATSRRAAGAGMGSPTGGS